MYSEKGKLRIMVQMSTGNVEGGACYKARILNNMCCAIDRVGYMVDEILPC